MSGRLEVALAELAAAIREEIAGEIAGRGRAPVRLLSVDEAAERLGIERTAPSGRSVVPEIRTCLFSWWRIAAGFLRVPKKRRGGKPKALGKGGRKD